MVCLGFEPGVAGWKVQMNPLNYSGPPSPHLFEIMLEKTKNKWKRAGDWPIKKSYFWLLSWIKILP